jgi:SH3-like domain-containing protein
VPRLQIQFHRWRPAHLAIALCLLVLLLACNKSFKPPHEYLWVSAPQANLRDKLVSLYTKTGIVHNADRVEVLEKQKRFVRVRTAAGVEGWVEMRYLVGPEVYAGFQKLGGQAAKLPSQGVAATRASVNMHLTPSRDSEILYQLKDGDKVDVMKRAVSEKAQPAGSPKPAGTARVPVNTAAGAPGAQAQLVPAAERAAGRGSPDVIQPVMPVMPVMEDWWLVRDSAGHAGWVLGRLLDLDVPLDVAQYAEGQRIVGCFKLNEVQDGDRKVSQYLTLITEPHDGAPYDFDQVRVFTWNMKRHRYETAYRERKLFGVLPVQTGTQDFGKDGVLPVFTIRAQDESGQSGERTYRLIGPVVRRVLPAGEANTHSASASTLGSAAPQTRSVTAHRSHRRRRR